MDKKNIEISVPKTLYNEINKYCSANEIGDVNEFIIKLLKAEFNREKYGEIGSSNINLTDDITDLLQKIELNFKWVKNKLNSDKINVEVNDNLIDIRDDDTVNNIIEETVIEVPIKKEEVSDTEYDNIKLITKKKSRRLK